MAAAGQVEAHDAVMRVEDGGVGGEVGRGAGVGLRKDTTRSGGGESRRAIGGGGGLIAREKADAGAALLGISRLDVHAPLLRVEVERSERSRLAEVLNLFWQGRKKTGGKKSGHGV